MTGWIYNNTTDYIFQHLTIKDELTADKASCIFQEGILLVKTNKDYKELVKTNKDYKDLM